MYMASSKAFKKRILNQQDFFNEYIIAASIYWKMLYTDLVENQDDQYNFAKMEMSFILIYCFINLIIIILATVYSNKKVFIYIYNHAIHKYNLLSLKTKVQS